MREEQQKKSEGCDDMQTRKRRGRYILAAWLLEFKSLAAKWDDIDQINGSINRRAVREDSYMCPVDPVNKTAKNIHIKLHSHAQTLSSASDSCSIYRSIS